MSEQSTSSLASRRSTARASRKPKVNQIPFGVIAVLVIAVIAMALAWKSSNLAFFWITGCIFGLILQKGRFCFTASMRDPYLTGSTSITRAVLVAFAITTLGFSAIKYGYFMDGRPIPGMSFVVPISMATIVGAFLFGIGMVIAGGCASGTLMRVGEGFAMNSIAIVFFIIGSLWGAHDFGWWKEHFISKGPSIFLPDVLGWSGAILIQLCVIAALYIIAERYEKKRTGL